MSTLATAPLHVSPWLPRVATIKDVQAETAGVTTYALDLGDHDRARDPEVGVLRVRARRRAEVADAGLEDHRRRRAVARGEIGLRVRATVVRALDEHDRAARGARRDAAGGVSDYAIAGNVRAGGESFCACE